MHEQRPTEPLDYAKLSTLSGFNNNGAMRIIGTSIIFVGATILAVGREDTAIIGMAIGSLALIGFAMEYFRSW
jgi:hypothetical protein